MAMAQTLYSRSHEATAAAEMDLRALVGGVACLDFVNTTDRHDAMPTFDYFAPGYANLLAWFEHARFVDSSTAGALLRLARRDPRTAAAVRKRAQTLRSAIHGVALALSSDVLPAESELAILDDERQLASTNGRYDSVGGRLTWTWTTTRALDQLLWPIVRSATETLSSDLVNRIRECAAVDCQAVFLDGSKNGSRRFCSAATCGNATRVRRFRVRQESAPRSGI